MQSHSIDLLARAVALPQTRRRALLTAAAIVVGADAHQAEARKQNMGQIERRSRGRAAFSRKCRRFIIAAGPNRDDRFQHTDDDLRIEVIPKKGGPEKVIFDDDNNAPNGDNGEHLRVTPFTARVGDKIHIVARNEVAGGCELDEIWLHCIEGKGGKVKLSERILPADCQLDANQIGVFFEKTVRLKNK